MASTRYRGLVGTSYTLRNVRFDCQRTVNLYPEVDETGLGKNGEVAQLTRTPGLTELLATNSQAGLAMYVASDGRLFSVQADGLYLITSAPWTRTKKASFSPSGNVQITDNGISLFIISDGEGWTVNLTTYVLATITVPRAVVEPSGPNVMPMSVAYLDGGVILADKGTNTFYWTELFSTVVNTLNFASAEANPDTIMAVFNNNEDLWVFGHHTTEIWYNSGPSALTGVGSNTVYSRRQGILVETGCASTFTICKMNKNRIMWLARDDRGGPTVVLSEGYSPTRVSTFAIERAWDGLTEEQIDAASAYSYNQDGHMFYVLNIPGVSSTWVYDVTTSDQLQTPCWHERTWTNPMTGAQSRHRSQGHAVYQNKHVVMDYEDGALYSLDQDAFDDAGDKITRERTAPHISNDGKRLFYNWLAVDFKTGNGQLTGFTDPTVMLDYSNDGGVTWSNQIERSAGAMGNYSARVIFHQLGTARDRVFRIRMTDPVDWALSGAAIDIQQGAW